MFILFPLELRLINSVPVVSCRTTRSVQVVVQGAQEFGVHASGVEQERKKLMTKLIGTLTGVVTKNRKSLPQGDVAPIHMTRQNGHRLQPGILQ